VHIGKEPMTHNTGGVRMNRNSNGKHSTTTVPGTNRTARKARSLGRLTAATLALAAPVAAAGAVLTSTAANATTVPSYALHLSGHSASFGSVNIGARVAKKVTLTNTGSKALQPVQVTSGSGEFSVGGSCVKATVAPGKSCAYTVTFAPTTAGAVAASMQVFSVQGTPAQSVALSGTGVVQQMQAYNYLYTFTSPPVINGVQAPQSFQGTGFAAAGTYAFGQTIPVFDAAGLNQIGTYRIGTVTVEPLNAAQVNTVTVTSYTWGTMHYIIGTGLSAGTATSGLGSEGGSVNGAPFSDHWAAFQPSHW
jgi:hypothetical protein